MKPNFHYQKTLAFQQCHVRFKRLVWWKIWIHTVYTVILSSIWIVICVLFEQTTVWLSSHNPGTTPDRYPLDQNWIDNFPNWYRTGTGLILIDERRGFEIVQPVVENLHPSSRDCHVTKLSMSFRYLQLEKFCCRFHQITLTFIYFIINKFLIRKYNSNDQASNDRIYESRWK